MINRVRACFCLPNIIDEDHLRILLQNLERFGINRNGTLDYYKNLWSEQKLIWNISDKSWEASILQLTSEKKPYSTFSFNLDASYFIPDGKITYFPDNDPLFINYKNILVYILIQITPLIGEIDFDADLICSELSQEYPYKIASWGNYFSFNMMSNIEFNYIKSLTDICDEIIPIESYGYLTFIHPMDANRAWSNKHEKLEKIIRDNINLLIP